MFLLRLVWAVVNALFAKKADLVAENLALRQQLNVLRRKVGRPRLRRCGYQKPRPPCRFIRRGGNP